MIGLIPLKYDLRNPVKPIILGQNEGLLKPIILGTLNLSVVTGCHLGCHFLGNLVTALTGLRGLRGFKVTTKVTTKSLKVTTSTTLVTTLTTTDFNPL